MTRRHSFLTIFSIAILTVALAFIQSRADATGPGSPIEVTGASAMPAKAAPPDVVTFRLGLGNNVGRVENLEVQIKVLGPQGTQVLQTMQSGINVSDRSTQAVYWVWRTPANLSEGNYTLRATVVDKKSNKVLVAEKDVASFELVSSTFGLN